MGLTWAFGLHFDFVEFGNFLHGSAETSFVYFFNLHFFVDFSGISLCSTELHNHGMCELLFAVV